MTFNYSFGMWAFTRLLPALCLHMNSFLGVLLASTKVKDDEIPPSPQIVIVALLLSLAIAVETLKD